MRRAFNYAFDFEEMNKQLFFGQYKRIDELFRGHRARLLPGLPQGQELEILETVRDKVPPEVFTTPYTNPVGGNPEKRARQSARGDAAAEGGRLRGPQPEAGQRQDRRAVHASRFLARRSEHASASSCSTSRRSSGSASPSRVRTVDDAQYENRLRNWDFDIIIAVWAGVAVARQRAARLSGARRRPTSRARATTSASRIRRSTR